MVLAKSYLPAEVEPRLWSNWEQNQFTNFNIESEKTLYSIDTPPPTVSGKLHLGHVYSYSQVDFIARYKRMQGFNVYYPMGFDDNGLPTERLVEKQAGVNPSAMGRSAFRQLCLETSVVAEQAYQRLWQRLGLSIDWRFTYRTIDVRSQRIAQNSFIELYRKGMIYRKSAPVVWCSTCRTAIAQAELDDLEQSTEMITLPFAFVDRKAEDSNAPESIAVGTTRPELLPACVAIFIHPEDPRYQSLRGRMVRVPVFGQTIPILTDTAAEPEKGTGAVMCCTFGDRTDVEWWIAHDLPWVSAMMPDGTLSEQCGILAGLTIMDARKEIKRRLSEARLILDRQVLMHSIRVHERCDTPTEYLITPQWFSSILDLKMDLINIGKKINWHPEFMLARYLTWVENLNMDWCLSRQRFYGVPIPVWYCQECGIVNLPTPDQLPVDPLETNPRHPCLCGSSQFTPESDVLDTWATSSLSPQIAASLVNERYPDRTLLPRIPFSLRPQAHEIIRTWAFYTIVKSFLHENSIPWESTLISGWGLAGEGMGKISKSKGGESFSPMEVIERYSADAVRYWAASTGPGKDTVISEEKIQMGSKLVTKLWNVARFSERFFGGYSPNEKPERTKYTPADRWILARLQDTISKATQALEEYEYSTAKSTTETFFWNDFTDNYLEMSKVRLYEGKGQLYLSARYVLYILFLAILKLFAPFLPYVTDEIYQSLFAQSGNQPSIHTSPWPQVDESWLDEAAVAYGALLVDVATVLRRYKSIQNLPLGTPIPRLQLAPVRLDPELQAFLRTASVDLKGITRAERIEITSSIDPDMLLLPCESQILVGIMPTSSFHPDQNSS